MPPAASKLGRGKPIKNQTKEVLQKIYRYFESEIDRDPNSTVTAAQLVAHATGISRSALKRALSEDKATTVKCEYKPTRGRCKKNIVSDGYDSQAIRRIIHNFYTKDEEFPIMKDLHLILKADIDYQGSLRTLRRHVAKLGFKWVEKADNNTVLIEKHEFRYTRIQYVTQIEGYRGQGRNVVYTGEMSIESSRISSKPKPDGTSTMLKQPAKSKLVILLAGDEMNIIKNSLFIYDGNKKDLKEENDSKRENFEQYDKWFKYQLIPILKSNSIVVVDGGLAFHNRITNPTPHSNSRKKDIMDYLTVRNVPYSIDMYKPQLYQLVLINKDKHNEYKTDALLREHGHTILRLPAHHPDLNPVITILSSVIEYVGKNTSLNSESIIKIVREKVFSITPEDWKHACKTAEAEANSLKAVDKVIDELSERTFRSLNEDSNESEGEDDNLSEQDSVDSD